MRKSYQNAHYFDKNITHQNQLEDQDATIINISPTTQTEAGNSMYKNTETTLNHMPPRLKNQTLS